MSMQIYRSLDEVVEAGSISPDSIINADCLEAMKFLPDKSIDCIICDLPYGVTACKWDIVIPFDLLWEQYKRIIKPNGAIVLFGSQPFTSALVMSNPKWFKYEWIWDKNTPTGFLNAKKAPLKQHENILIFGEKLLNYTPQKELKKYPGYRNEENHNKSKLKEGAYGSKIMTKGNRSNFRHPKSILQYQSMSGHNSGVHPTQKPVPLIEYLIKTYTLENELILDNTAGSGTLAIAASTPTAVISA